MTDFILAEVEAAARRITEAPSQRAAGTFEVLCRIDAFADYIAEIEAPNAKQAAVLAHGGHGDYKWEHWSTEEFDARLYVTLDDAGSEIEETRIGDF